MNEISTEEIAQKYNEIDVIWNEKDKWHLRTKKMINDFVVNSFKSISNFKDLKILNAGSAGYSYGLDEKNILHIDIANDKISHLPNSLVIDIHNLSKISEKFDMVMCVGSVINYCDPIKVITEFSKILKDKGYIILEFENSHTLELAGTSSFNKKAVLIKSFYNGKPEKIWFFSESYIKELLELSGFKMLSVKRCHIFSPLVYRIYSKENFASYFGKLDSFLSYIPFLRRFSSNTIFLFVKK
jgi:hypothetical protein